MEQEILVIGHDAQYKKQLVDTLSDKSWRVRALPHGVEMALISCLPQVALIVLDVSPVEAGKWTALHTIRERSTVPVIALVGDNDSRVTIECLDCGADFVMTKPIDSRELGARIGALLRRVQMVAQPAGGSVQSQMNATDSAQAAVESRP